MAYKVKFRVELVDDDGNEYVVQKPAFGVGDDQDFGYELGRLLGTIQSLMTDWFDAADILAHAVVERLYDETVTTPAPVVFCEAARAYLGGGTP